MIEILLIIICVILAIAVGFMIPVLIELKMSAKETLRFLKRNEAAFSQTLSDLSDTLRSIRGVAEDIKGVTEDARTFTGSVAGVGQDLKALTGSLEELATQAAARVSGLRVGLITAMDVLLHNLIRKGGGK
ncbi:MAG: hypothetical protein Kow0025_20160 [Thermodesulfovibrionales bacterium]